MITLGSELLLPDERVIPADQIKFRSGRVGLPWDTRTPDQIMFDMSKVLVAANYHSLHHSEMFISGFIHNWLAVQERRHCVHLLLTRRRARRPVRFTVKEKKC
jgi:hypothetical protein